MSERPKRKTLSPRHSPESRAIFDRFATAKFGGAGSYHLARDECGKEYAGPDWAPFNLWQLAEYGDGHEQAYAQTFCYGEGAQALWAAVEARYPHPDFIPYNLPVVCANARAGWAAIPRLTPSEYRKHREKLARNAEQLATELERFYMHRDDSEFPGIFDFTEVMTQDELDRFHKAIQFTTFHIANRAIARADVPAVGWDEYNDIGKRARELGYRTGSVYTAAEEDMKGVYELLQRDHSRPDWPYGGVPSLPDMMRRIAAKFAEDGEDAPVARPNLANAERNFFARALCKYFWQSYGDISPAIIRDIVCMLYPQGIEENDVSQMAARVKAAFPLPREPETSDWF